MGGGHRRGGGTYMAADDAWARVRLGESSRDRTSGQAACKTCIAPSLQLKLKVVSVVSDDLAMTLS